MFFVHPVVEMDGRKMVSKEMKAKTLRGLAIPAEDGEGGDACVMGRAGDDDHHMP